jgi:hypothetical protein
VTGFTFDDGDAVYAQFQIQNDAAGDPGVQLLEWESGFISSRGLESIDEDVVESSVNS